MYVPMDTDKTNLIYAKDLKKMKSKNKERIIKKAIQNYKKSTKFGFNETTANAINIMEEAYYMCMPYNTNGINELKQTIKQAKEKYKDQLQELHNQDNAKLTKDDMIDLIQKFGIQPDDSVEDALNELTKQQLHQLRNICKK